MAESNGEMLFQDVELVQSRLESHSVIDYDANRIYDRLETYIHENDRVTLVVNDILKTVNVPCNIPDSSSSEADESQDTIILDDDDSSFPNILDGINSARKRSSTVDLDSDDDNYIAGGNQLSNGPIETVTINNSNSNSHDIDESEVNNNNPNNTDINSSENPVSNRCGSNEAVLNIEALQIQDIVPQLSVEEIHSYLKKCEFIPNRFNIVVDLCLNKHSVSPGPVSNEGQSVSGSSSCEPGKATGSSEHTLQMSEGNILGQVQHTAKSRENDLQQSMPVIHTPLEVLSAEHVFNRQHTLSCDPKEFVLEPGDFLVSPFDLPGTSVASTSKPSVQEESTSVLSDIFQERTHISTNLVIPKENPSAPKIIKKSKPTATISVAPPDTSIEEQPAHTPHLSVTQENHIIINQPNALGLVATPTFASTTNPEEKSDQNVEANQNAHALDEPDVILRDFLEVVVKHLEDSTQAQQDTLALGNQSAEVQPLAPTVMTEDTLNATHLVQADHFMGPEPSCSKRKILVDVAEVAVIDKKKPKLPVSTQEVQPTASATIGPHKYLKTIEEMFPTVDEDYLQQRCSELGPNDSIDVLITVLLDTPNMPVKTPKEEPPKVMSDSEVAASYQAFQDILSDADPEFLQETWKKIGHSPDEVKQFVTDAIENRTYPKLEDYNRRMKMAALEKKFTDEFTIEGFLEMFPDPFTHFANLSKTGQLTHTLVEGRSFLMARYPKVRCSDIDRSYRRCSYNLLLTCKELQQIKHGLLKTARKKFEIPVYKTNKNISFLQEIAFIENEEQIRKYIQDRSEGRKKRFEEAKAKNELLECGCCYDNQFLPEDMAYCNDGHIFCKECIRQGAEVEIGKGKTDLPCLMDCGQIISLSTLKGILKPSVFTRLDQRKQMEEVKAACIEDLEVCPFCDFGTIPSHDDKIFKCLNPDCMKESCRLCKEPSHIPLRCNEVEKSEEIKLRTYIEDRMTEALVRTCWKCKKKFIKEDGCNKMTCPCGALMCYLCRQPVKDYSHFNGQGGDAYDKCPLYSNNEQLHVDAVVEEARKAKQEVEQKNPEVSLKHDPTKVLPKSRNPPNQNVPPPRPGFNAIQEEEDDYEEYDDYSDSMDYSDDDDLGVLDDYEDIDSDNDDYFHPWTFW